MKKVMLIPAVVILLIASTFATESLTTYQIKAGELCVGWAYDIGGGTEAAISSTAVNTIYTTYLTTPTILPGGDTLN